MVKSLSCWITSVGVGSSHPLAGRVLSANARKQPEPLRQCIKLVISWTSATISTATPRSYSLDFEVEASEQYCIKFVTSNTALIRAPIGGPDFVLSTKGSGLTNDGLNWRSLAGGG